LLPTSVAIASILIQSIHFKLIKLARLSSVRQITTKKLHKKMELIKECIHILERTQNEQASSSTTSTYSATPPFFPSLNRFNLILTRLQNLLFF